MNAVSLTRKHIEKTLLPILTEVREATESDLSFADCERMFTPLLTEEYMMTLNGWIWFIGRALHDESLEIAADTLKLWQYYGELSMAQALVPVDDGDLKESIKATSAGKLTPLYGGGGQQKVGELAVRITAGNSKIRYAALVEFGTKAMSAIPYFWPSYRSLAKRIRGRTTRAVNNAFKKALR